MDQVLRNLISNALKFSPSGGKVLVRARFVPDPQNDPSDPLDPYGDGSHSGSHSGSVKGLGMGGAMLKSSGLSQRGFGGLSGRIAPPVVLAPQLLTAAAAVLTGAPRPTPRLNRIVAGRSVSGRSVSGRSVSGHESLHSRDTRDREHPHDDSSQEDESRALDDVTPVDATTRGLLVIEVVDEGAGISADNQRLLFKEMVQFSPEKVSQWLWWIGDLMD